MTELPSKRVLVLSPYPERLESVFLGTHDEVAACAKPIELSYCSEREIDWIVVYGYRHLVRGSLLDKFRGRMINLHIALLPWNRGADPNFWSWYDNTPKGVTIHLVDAGIDTGDIVAQEYVTFTGTETLRTSYGVLCRRIESLFARTWRDLREGAAIGWPQPLGGSYHRKADKDPILRSLILGWDTPVAEVEAMGRLSHQV